jgi:hypothetical protein
VDDLEAILCCVGAPLCKRQIEDLVDKVIDLDTGKVAYQKMIDQGQL